MSKPEVTTRSLNWNGAAAVRPLNLLNAAYSFNESRDYREAHPDNLSEGFSLLGFDFGIPTGRNEALSIDVNPRIFQYGYASNYADRRTLQIDPETGDPRRRAPAVERPHAPVHLRFQAAPALGDALRRAAESARAAAGRRWDGDGEVHALSASQVDDEIAWYENLNGDGGFGTKSVSSTAADYAFSVTAADVDGDGDVDVLSASGSDDKIAWYENVDGAGGFGPQRVISTEAEFARCVAAAGVDGDGDVDALSASQTDDKIAWYENLDGAGRFGSQRVISTSGYGALAVLATDVDSDGDTDVLAGSSWDVDIAWYENRDGVGGFGPASIIATSSEGPMSVFAADLDGDGDRDVLISAQNNDDKFFSPAL